MPHTNSHANSSHTALSHPLPVSTAPLEASSPNTPPAPSPNTPLAHTPTRLPIVFAHRGLPTRAPENTLAAFRLARGAGARWLELDVDILADGTPIILHDSTLNRTTNRPGSIYALRSGDLSRVDAGAWFSPQYTGEPIPTLAEVVGFLNETGMHCNVELKSNEVGGAEALRLVENTLSELDNLDAKCEIIISSFNPLLLAEVHRRAPQYTLGALFGHTTLHADWRAITELCGATYVHVEDHPSLAQFVPRAREEGFGVNVWTVNSRGRANELFNMGATGVFTDIVDEMIGLEALHSA